MTPNLPLQPSKAYDRLNIVELTYLYLGLLKIIYDISKNIYFGQEKEK